MLVLIMWLIIYYAVIWHCMLSCAVPYSIFITQCHVLFCSVLFCSVRLRFMGRYCTCVRATVRLSLRVHLCMLRATVCVHICMYIHICVYVCMCLTDCCSVCMPASTSIHPIVSHHPRYTEPHSPLTQSYVLTVRQA